jgi:hypothetical protein
VNGIPMQTVTTPRGVAMVAILLSIMSPAHAQDASQPPSLVEDLEFRIEIGRHERFVERRAARDATLAPFRSDGCSGGLSSGWAFVSNAAPAVALFYDIVAKVESCRAVNSRRHETGSDRRLSSIALPKSLVSLT